MGTANWAEHAPEQTTNAWLRAHHELSRLARERAAADAEEGRWLLAALRSATHLHLGFASFNEYIERSFGYKPRTTQEKLRVAEALEDLPALTQALEQGTLHWSAARELTRVATPENEQEWLALAHGKTLRQLEELTAGKTPGDGPDSPPRPSERRHILRFEVTPETFALFREALITLRRNTDQTLDDDATLLALARLALGGPRDEGRASYQIALTLCAACGQGRQTAGGELIPISAEIVDMAHCDGQHLGCVTSHAANDSTPEPSPPSNNDAHVGADLPARDDSPFASNSSSMRTPAPEVRHSHAHVGAGLHAHVSANPALPRAKQTTPPALRRTILARDHHRCRVPGCRNAAFVDLHHLQLRSEGGPNDPQNLLTLCGAHHRASHRGQLLIDGTATTARFRHADGSDYGSVADPQALEARARAFRALRALGFREADVHAALAQLERGPELTSATTQQWLRAALARLTPPRPRR